MLSHLPILLFLLDSVASGSKAFNGQRMFTDLRIISFIDPAKHGFHVILDEDFVKSHLQPVHLPTVYVSAIGLRPPPPPPAARPGSSNASDAASASSPSASSAQSSAFARDDSLRVTKVLYPENGNPEDGLLDGRTIKLLGLQERTWYYVCVEFESNVNRHEIATGTSCRLARTLDKFGKTIESTISEIELIEISHDTIRVQLTVDTDFPLRLHVYTSGSMDSGGGVDPLRARATSTPSAQTFFVKKSQSLNVLFADLHPDTSYGRICVYEEPLVEAYTAMGRSARVAFEHCYFDALKTKPGGGGDGDSRLANQHHENSVFVMSEQPRSSKANGQREVASRLVLNRASNGVDRSSSVIAAVVVWAISRLI